MNNNFFNSDFDSILRRMMQDMQNSNQTSNKKYYINGKEVSPEELAQFTQQGGNHSAEQSAQAFQQAALRQQGQQSGNGNYLEQIGRNLTQEARDGLLDPVIGRDKEIQETAEVLSRRTKNNPILVGEAGVGKTAIVEGLAQAIVEGNVPAAIKDKEIISIDISSLEAGTQYRGAFEENIQKLVEGVKSSQNAVLFFDEIHQIIGSGATGSDSGSKGLSDILKPALSRGEISIIGATTQDEYRNNIMKDAALTRRFNEVLVNEPSAKDTVEILKGIREKFETHHQVKLPDDVLKACVDLSIQYIPQRLLPDKAIDVLDITAAHLSAQSPAIDKVATEKRISELEHDKRKAVSAEEYKKADDIQNEIKSLQDILENSNGEHTAVATVHDISDTIQRLTGIPVSQMDANDIERLKNISSRLRSKIIGQDKAVEMVSRAIRRNRAGFDDGNRPIGSFLFVGPTGVGNGTDQEYDDIMQEMKKFFRPEFLNRFNGIVEFLHLDKESLQEIINLLLDDVQVTLDKKGITMNVSQDAKDWLIEEGYDEDLGARPLRRIVEQQVRDKITDYYLDHTDVKHVDLDIEDNELVVKGKS
ncbi:TPA: ATP-dependent Clp protease ATP-binding subunit [Staphylococcus aureus]|nr:ATP-dependent Clp protease ATP-binding subunit [Staphylococcus aureus]